MKNELDKHATRWKREKKTVKINKIRSPHTKSNRTKVAKQNLLNKHSERRENVKMKYFLKWK